MRREGKKLTLVARLWALGQIHSPEQDDADTPVTVSQGNTADALAAWGLVAEGPLPAPQASSKVYYLWPENLLVYRLWRACQTQWKDGMGGRTGLDYTGVEIVMHRRFGLRGKKGDEPFALLQAMEIAALNGWASQKDAT